MIREQVIIVFFSAFLLAGCVSKTSGIPTVMPLGQCEPLENLSGIVDSLDFIILEESDNSILTYPDKIIVLPKKSLLVKDRGGKIFHFSPEGQFLRKIGTKGRGPMEYMSVQDICVSKDGKEVHILDLGSIVSYDISTGGFLRKLPIPHHNYDEFCPNESGGFYTISASPDFDNFDFGKDHSVLTVLSENGEVDKTMLPRKDYILNVSLITRSYKGSYYIRPLEGEDILYELSERLYSRASISFGNNSSPKYYAVDNGRLNIERYVESRYYKTILNFHDTMRNEYFACIGPNGNCTNFVMDGDFQKGVSWVDKIYDETPAVVAASDENFYYIIVYDVKSYLSKSDDEINPMTRLIVLRIEESKLTVNDNPLVVRMSINIGVNSRDHVQLSPVDRYYSIGKQSSADDPKTFYLDGRFHMAGGEDMETLNESILKIMFEDYLGFPIAGEDKLAVAAKARYASFDNQFRSMSSTMDECHLNVKELGCFAGRAGNIQTYIKRISTNDGEMSVEVHLLDLQTGAIVELSDIIGKDESARIIGKSEYVGVSKKGLVLYDVQDAALIVSETIPWTNLSQYIREGYQYVLDIDLYGDDNVEGPDIMPQVAIHGKETAL